MRYHFIAYRQPIIGCLFLFLFLLSCTERKADRTLSRLQANAVLIEYAGDQSLEQNDFIQINGTLFWHDTLYMLRSKTTDTVYLPTQRFIADQPYGGRPVYSTANALSCMIQMADVLLSKIDTTRFKLDVSGLPVGRLRIDARGNEPVEVIATKDYPLRITAAKN
jgi:hypothetical protein